MEVTRHLRALFEVISLIPSQIEIETKKVLLTFQAVQIMLDVVSAKGEENRRTWVS
jgi:hypothetical protein